MKTAVAGSEYPSGKKTLEIFGKATHFNHWLYKSFSPYCKGNILEIGSGTGNISRLLLQQGNAVTLSDINPDYCHRLASVFENEVTLQGVFQFDLSDPDFISKYPQFQNQFDTIVGLNVVEHIKDDQMVIRNASKLLRYKGRIIILVPAFQGLYNSFDHSLGHYRRYTRKKLVMLLQSEGLELIGSKYFNVAGIAGWWFFGSLLNRNIIPAISLKIFDIMVPLLKTLDWICFRKIGLSVVAIAEKT
jgi:2-polyprenyl-3-methyl-5-hydroxy-6-metoxy-1,4-benzoquinol methylase